MSDETENKNEGAPAPENEGPSVAAESADKVKKVVSSLPNWEKITLIGGIVYLVCLYAFNFAKVSTSGSIANLTDYTNKAGYSFADDGGFWFFLALIAAIVAIVLPFLKIIAPQIKLPFAKGLLYFVAGIAAVISPVANYVFTPDKSQSFYEFTLKLNPDIGFYLLLAAGVAIAFGAYQAGGLKMLMDQVQSARKATPPSEPPTAE